MRKQKWLALVVILILALGSLTGCSPVEKSYYGLMMEINNQKVYTDSGSLQLNLAQLPTSAVAAGEGALDQAVLFRALNQHRIDYTGKADLNNKIMQYDFTIVDTVTNVKTPVLTLIAKDQVFYLKIDELVKYLGQFSNPAEKQELDQILGGVVWVSLSSQELNAMLPAGSPPVIRGDIFQMSSTQLQVWTRLLDSLVNDAYKGYQSGLVTQNKNQYTLTVRGAELMNVIKPAAVYNINHIGELGAVLKAFLSGLSPDELTSLGWTAAMKTEMLEAVDLMVQDVNQNQAQYLAQLEGISPVASQEIMKTLNDTELVSSLEKIDATTYKQDVRLHIHVSAGQPLETMEFTLSQQHSMKTGGTIAVASPSGPVITFTELEKRMPHKIEVNVDSGVYHSSSGFASSSGSMEVQLVNNYTYLPLRLIGESLGEEIGWDQARYQAYAEQNGQRIYMTSLFFNNRAFIKIRDFERLGYTVNWDQASRTANISK